jgi:hypothetical protein
MVAAPGTASGGPGPVGGRAGRPRPGCGLALEPRLWRLCRPAAADRDRWRRGSCRPCRKLRHPAAPRLARKRSGIGLGDHRPGRDLLDPRHFAEGLSLVQPPRGGRRLGDGAALDRALASVPGIKSHMPQGAGHGPASTARRRDRRERKHQSRSRELGRNVARVLPVLLPRPMGPRAPRPRSARRQDRRSVRQRASPASPSTARRSSSFPRSISWRGPSSTRRRKGSTRTAWRRTPACWRPCSRISASRARSRACAPGPW